MAKMMDAVTVTVKNDNSESIYSATSALISGNGDQFHPVLNIRLDNFKPKGTTTLIRDTSCAKAEGYSYAKDTPELDAMIEAAQALDLATLGAANDLYVAQRAAENKIQQAQHKLNYAIQQYMHTGHGNLDAVKALEARGIYALDDRAEAVAVLDLDRLYGVDITSAGK